MTQDFLARLAEVTQPTIANWLNGTTPYPSHVNRLCLIFGVRRDWLLYGEGKKELPTAARRAVVREGDSEYGALLKKVAIIEESGNPDLIAQVDAYLDLACRQLGVRRDKTPNK